MKTIRLKLKENSHNIVVGKNILSGLGVALKKLKIGQDAIIITNPAIERHHGKTLIKSLKQNGFSVKVLSVPAGEKSKSASVAFSLMEKIARYDVYKKVFIVAFGGGVVGDLAGYVAAAYKRGIPYVQVATTFLAQIDSAIGGKVAIDLPIGKNLVGAFYQPKLVWSDVNVLKTLDQRQVRNGFAEAIKYGIIKDAKLFSLLEKNSKALLGLKGSLIEEVVVQCSRIKANVVMMDEKETKNIRTILNFGHTIGHAIEAAGGYTLYHHGEAIALGMRIATRLSSEKNLISDAVELRINKIIDSYGLPTKAQKVSLNKILSVMKHDKKFVAGKNRFVLAKKIGDVKVEDGLPVELLRRVTKVFLA